MICPYCHYPNTKVNETRESEESITRRRRECLRCKKRFTTYERIEMVDLVVIKKDGTHEQFSRDKLYSGIKRACNKRPVDESKVVEAVDTIERYLRKLKSTEVKSKIIGDQVMKRLKKLDQIAYIRFASVYQDFDDINSFIEEIKKLQV